MALFEDLGPQDVMSAITSSSLVDVKLNDEDLYRMCLGGITVPTVSCPPIVLLDDTSMRKAISTRISLEMRHFPGGAHDAKVYRAFVLALGSLLAQLRRCRSSSKTAVPESVSTGTLDACHKGFSAIYEFTPLQAEKFKALLDSHPDSDTIDIPADGFLAPPVTAATLHTAATDMLAHLSNRTHFYSRGDEIMLAVATLMVLQDTHVLQQVPKSEVHFPPGTSTMDLPDELVAYAPIVMNGVDALARIRRSLTLVSARDVLEKLTQDTGFLVRRLLHHGIRLQAVASTCTIDAVALEAKRSANGMATVVAFGCPVRSGRWYFEATVLHKDMMQIGWCTERAAFDAGSGYGVGNDSNSWAWCGNRHEKLHGRESTSSSSAASRAYPHASLSSKHGSGSIRPWSKNDVVGVYLDLDRGDLAFSLNGQHCGVAFSGLKTADASGKPYTFYPAVSFTSERGFRLNFGSILGGASSSSPASMSAAFYAGDKRFGFTHPPIDSAFLPLCAATYGGAVLFDNVLEHQAMLPHSLVLRCAAEPSSGIGTGLAGSAGGMTTDAVPMPPMAALQDGHALEEYVSASTGCSPLRHAPVCLRYKETGGVITVPDHEDLRMTENFTFEMLVRPDTIDADAQVLAIKGDEWHGGWSLTLGKGGALIFTAFGHSSKASSDIAASGAFVTTAPGKVSPRLWQHIAVSVLSNVEQVSRQTVRECMSAEGPTEAAYQGNLVNIYINGILEHSSPLLPRYMVPGRMPAPSGSKKSSAAAIAPPADGSPIKLRVTLNSGSSLYIGAKKVGFGTVSDSFRGLFAYARLWCTSRQEKALTKFMHRAALGACASGVELGGGPVIASGKATTSSATVSPSQYDSLSASIANAHSELLASAVLSGSGETNASCRLLGGRLHVNQAVPTPVTISSLDVSDCSSNLRGSWDASTLFGDVLFDGAQACRHPAKVNGHVELCDGYAIKDVSACLALDSRSTSAPSDTSAGSVVLTSSPLRVRVERPATGAGGSTLGSDDALAAEIPIAKLRQQKSSSSADHERLILHATRDATATASPPSQIAMDLLQTVALLLNSFHGEVDALATSAAVSLTASTACVPKSPLMFAPTNQVVHPGVYDLPLIPSCASYPTAVMLEICTQLLTCLWHEYQLVSDHGAVIMKILCNALMLVMSNLRLLSEPDMLDLVNPQSLPMGVEPTWLAQLRQLVINVALLDAAGSKETSPQPMDQCRTVGRNALREHFRFLVPSALSQQQALLWALDDTNSVAGPIGLNEPRCSTLKGEVLSAFAKDPALVSSIVPEAMKHPLAKVSSVGLQGGAALDDWAALLECLRARVVCKLEVEPSSTLGLHKNKAVVPQAADPAEVTEVSNAFGLANMFGGDDDFVDNTTDVTIPSQAAEVPASALVETDNEITHRTDPLFWLPAHLKDAVREELDGEVFWAAFSDGVSLMDDEPRVSWFAVDPDSEPIGVDLLPGQTWRYAGLSETLGNETVSWDVSIEASAAPEHFGAVAGVACFSSTSGEIMSSNVWLLGAEGIQIIAGVSSPLPSAAVKWDSHMQFCFDHKQGTLHAVVDGNCIPEPLTGVRAPPNSILRPVVCVRSSDSNAAGEVYITNGSFALFEVPDSPETAAIPATPVRPAAQVANTDVAKLDGASEIFDYLAHTQESLAARFDNLHSAIRQHSSEESLHIDRLIMEIVSGFTALPTCFLRRDWLGAHQARKHVPQTASTGAFVQLRAPVGPVRIPSTRAAILPVLNYDILPPQDSTCDNAALVDAASVDSVASVLESTVSDLHSGGTSLEASVGFGRALSTMEHVLVGAGVGLSTHGPRGEQPMDNQARDPNMYNSCSHCTPPLQFGIEALGTKDYTFSNNYKRVTRASDCGSNVLNATAPVPRDPEGSLTGWSIKASSSSADSNLSFGIHVCDTSNCSFDDRLPFLLIDLRGRVFSNVVGDKISTTSGVVIPRDEAFEVWIDVKEGKLAVMKKSSGAELFTCAVPFVRQVSDAQCIVPLFSVPNIGDSVELLDFQRTPPSTGGFSKGKLARWPVDAVLSSARPDLGRKFFLQHQAANASMRPATSAVRQRFAYSTQIRQACQLSPLHDGLVSIACAFFEHYVAECTHGTLRTQLHGQLLSWLSMLCFAGQMPDKDMAEDFCASVSMSYSFDRLVGAVRDVYRLHAVSKQVDRVNHLAVTFLCKFAVHRVASPAVQLRLPAPADDEHEASNTRSFADVIKCFHAGTQAAASWSCSSLLAGGLTSATQARIAKEAARVDATPELDTFGLPLLQGALCEVHTEGFVHQLIAGPDDSPAARFYSRLEALEGTGGIVCQRLKCLDLDAVARLCAATALHFCGLEPLAAACAQVAGEQSLGAIPADLIVPYDAGCSRGSLEWANALKLLKAASHVGLMMKMFAAKMKSKGRNGMPCPAFVRPEIAAERTAIFSLSEFRSLFRFHAVHLTTCFVPALTVDAVSQLDTINALCDSVELFFKHFSGVVHPQLLALTAYLHAAHEKSRGDAVELLQFAIDHSSDPASKAIAIDGLQRAFTSIKANKSDVTLRVADPSFVDCKHPTVTSCRSLAARLPVLNVPLDDAVWTMYHPGCIPALLAHKSTEKGASIQTAIASANITPQANIKTVSYGATPARQIEGTATASQQEGGVDDDHAILELGSCCATLTSLRQGEATYGIGNAKFVCAVLLALRELAHAKEAPGRAMPLRAFAPYVCGTGVTTVQVPVRAPNGNANVVSSYVAEEVLAALAKHVVNTCGSPKELPAGAVNPLIRRIAVSSAGSITRLRSNLTKLHEACESVMSETQQLRVASARTNLTNVLRGLCESVISSLYDFHIVSSLLHVCVKDDLHAVVEGALDGLRTTARIRHLCARSWGLLAAGCLEEMGSGFHCRTTSAPRPWKELLTIQAQAAILHALQRFLSVSASATLQRIASMESIEPGLASTVVFGIVDAIEAFAEPAVSGISYEAMCAAARDADDSNFERILQETHERDWACVLASFHAGAAALKFSPALASSSCAKNEAAPAFSLNMHSEAAIRLLQSLQKALPRLTADVGAERGTQKLARLAQRLTDKIRHFPCDRLALAASATLRCVVPVLSPRNCEQSGVIIRSLLLAAADNGAPTPELPEENLPVRFRAGDNSVWPCRTKGLLPQALREIRLGESISVLRVMLCHNEWRSAVNVALLSALQTALDIDLSARSSETLLGFQLPRANEGVTDTASVMSSCLAALRVLGGFSESVRGGAVVELAPSKSLDAYHGKVPVHTAIDGLFPLPGVNYSLTSPANQPHGKEEESSIYYVNTLVGDTVTLSLLSDVERKPVGSARKDALIARPCREFDPSTVSPGIWLAVADVCNKYACQSFMRLPKHTTVVTPTVSAAGFSPEHSSAFVFEKQNKVVKNNTSGRAIIDQPITTGRWTWQFKLVKDENGSETTCFGVMSKPFADGYRSPNGWFYRCYNGFLYNQGNEDRKSKTQMHPGDIIKVDFDADAGTLAYSISGKELGVCFSDVHGEVYPAVVFYGSPREVELVSLERLDAIPQLEVTTTPLAPASSAATTFWKDSSEAALFSSTPLHFIGTPIEQVAAQEIADIHVAWQSACTTAMVSSISVASLKSFWSISLLPAATVSQLLAAEPLRSLLQSFRQRLLILAAQSSRTNGIADIPLAEATLHGLGGTVASLWQVSSSGQDLIDKCNLWSVGRRILYDVRAIHGSSSQASLMPDHAPLEVSSIPPPKTCLQLSPGPLFAQEGLLACVFRSHGTGLVDIDESIVDDCMEEEAGGDAFDPQLRFFGRSSSRSHHPDTHSSARHADPQLLLAPILTSWGFPGGTPASTGKSTKLSLGSDPRLQYMLPALRSSPDTVKQLEGCFQEVAATLASLYARCILLTLMLQWSDVSMDNASIGEAKSASSTAPSPPTLVHDSSVQSTGSAPVEQALVGNGAFSVEAFFGTTLDTAAGLADEAAAISQHQGAIPTLFVELMKQLCIRNVALTWWPIPSEAYHKRPDAVTSLIHSTISSPALLSSHSQSLIVLGAVDRNQRRRNVFTEERPRLLSQIKPLVSQTALADSNGNPLSFVSPFVRSVAVQLLTAAHRQFRDAILDDRAPSDAKAQVEPQVGFAQWATEVLLGCLDSTVSANSSNSALVKFIAKALVQSWSFLLKSPILLFKHLAMRKLIDILEKVRNAINTGTLDAHWEEVIAQVPLERLREMAVRRLDREREDAPRYSRYLQVLLELCALLPNDSPTTAEVPANRPRLTATNSSLDLPKPSTQMYARFHGNRRSKEGAQAPQSSCITLGGEASSKEVGTCWTVEAWVRLPAPNEHSSTFSLPPVTAAVPTAIVASPAAPPGTDIPGRPPALFRQISSDGSSSFVSTDSEAAPAASERSSTSSAAPPSSASFKCLVNGQRSCLVLQLGSLADSAPTHPGIVLTAAAAARAAISGPDKSKVSSSVRAFSHPIPTGRWVHVAFAATSARVAMLIDGVFMEEVEVPSPGMTLPLSSIGTQDGCSFNGDLHDLRVWRVTRSVGEVQRDMHSALPASLRPPSLLAYFSFDTPAQVGRYIADITGKCAKSIATNVSWHSSRHSPLQAPVQDMPVDIFKALASAEVYEALNFRAVCVFSRPSVGVNIGDAWLKDTRAVAHMYWTEWPATSDPSWPLALQEHVSKQYQDVLSQVVAMHTQHADSDSKEDMESQCSGISGRVEWPESGVSAEWVGRIDPKILQADSAELVNATRKFHGRVARITQGSPDALSWLVGASITGSVTGEELTASWGTCIETLVPPAPKSTATVIANPILHGASISSVQAGALIQHSGSSSWGTLVCNLALPPHLRSERASAAIDTIVSPRPDAEGRARGELSRGSRGVSSHSIPPEVLRALGGDVSDVDLGGDGEWAEHTSDGGEHDEEEEGSTPVASDADPTSRAWQDALGQTAGSVASSVGNTKSQGLSKGRVCWDVRVEKMTSEYIGIGLVTAGAHLDTYIGCDDKRSWSFQMNSECWHRGSSSRFGDKPAQGDLISVEVDMDAGTVEYLVNGKSIGIAFDKLQSQLSALPSIGGPHAVLPAVSLYNDDDAVRLYGLKQGFWYRSYNAEKSAEKVRTAGWYKHAGNWKDGQPHGPGMLFVRTGSQPSGADVPSGTGKSWGPRSGGTGYAAQVTALKTAARANIGPSAVLDSSSPEKDDTTGKDGEVDIAGYWLGEWHHGAMTGIFRWYACPASTTVAQTFLKLSDDVKAFLSGAPKTGEAGDLATAELRSRDAFITLLDAPGESQAPVPGGLYMLADGVMTRALTAAEIASQKATLTSARASRATELAAQSAAKAEAEDAAPTKVKVRISGEIEGSADKLFLFMPSQCGNTIKISPELDSLRCASNSQSIVLGSQGFSSGVHYWEVFVDHAQFGDVYIGVAERAFNTSSPMPTLVPATSPAYMRDHLHGAPSPSLNTWRDYGWINYMAVSTPHTGERIYGSFYSSGDRVGVLLNMDEGTVSFVKDSVAFDEHKVEIFDVAFHHVRSGAKGGPANTMLFPMIGMKKNGDKVSIGHHRWISRQGLSSRELLSSLMKGGSLARCWSAAGPTPLPPPLSCLRAAYAHFQNMHAVEQGGGILTLATRAGIHAPFDRSAASCRRAFLASGGSDDLVLQAGDRIRTDRGEGIIVGAYRNRLWYTLDNFPEHGAWYFTGADFEDAVAAGMAAILESAPPVVVPDSSCALMDFDTFCKIAADSTWTLQRDEEIVRLANQQCDKLGKDPEALAIQLPTEATAAATGIEWMISSADASLPLSHLRARFSVLVVLNKHLGQLLPLADLTVKRSRGAVTTDPAAIVFPSALGRRIASLRGLIFTRVKNRFWNAVIKATVEYTQPPQELYDRPEGIPELKISRIRARKEVLTKLNTRAERLKSSIFGQIMEKSKSWKDSAFRRAYSHVQDAGQQRCFFVKFLGEGVDDNGGPYRAAVQAAVGEEPVSVLELFAPCPNALNDIGLNRDQMVFNPASSEEAGAESAGAAPPTSTTACACGHSEYRFFGALAAMAIRNHILLPINFSSLILRPLVSLPVRPSDISATDTRLSELLEVMQAIKSDASSIEAEARDVAGLRDAAAAVVQHFGRFAPAKAHSAAAQLDFTNRDAFASYMRSVCARRGHSAHHFESFLEGLSAVLPSELFPLYTPEEMEVMMCGQLEIDLDILKKATVYDFVSPTTPQIIWLWEILEEFTPQLRSSFVNFVSARSRIPASADAFVQPFKIEGAGGAMRARPDDFLPQTQTCFSKLMLPLASTKDILRNKLLFAMHHAVTMDADVRSTSAEGYDLV